MNIPASALSLVCVSLREGNVDVLQHIPLNNTTDPPFEVIFPPDVAVVLDIPVAAIVVNEGIVGEVVKVSSSP